MELANKRIGVFGLGITGRAVTEYLLKHGAVPVCADEVAKPEKLDSLTRYVSELGVESHLGAIPTGAFTKIDLAVVSPGINPKNPVILAAQEAGTPVISEIDLAYRRCPCPIVAVTGSNGKSTTTALLAHILNGFRRAVAAGNIGLPFISQVDGLSPDDVVCCEVSSFQLEFSPEFHPRIAVYTNITPDHLERHLTFENYAEVKRGMVKTMGENDTVVYNAEDESLQPDEFPRKPVAFLPFSSVGEIGPPGAYLEDSQMWFMVEGTEISLPRTTLKLPGLHNVENALAAGLAARLLGAKKQDLDRGLSTFEGFEHRIEFVREKDGVRYYNDSKATNPEAAVTALKSFDRPIVLIAGGRDKGTDLGEFVSHIKQTAREVILLGEAAARFSEALSHAGYSNTHMVSDYPAAVKLASVLARPGDIVLLSPACASFDMFDSFEQRGTVFKTLVMEL